MPQTHCLVCGYSIKEVEKMHRFPFNSQKSKIWQEKMAMKPMAEVSLHNYLICSRHFTPESYVNATTKRLRTDAVPSLFPAYFPENQNSVHQVQGHSVICSSTVGELTDTPLNVDPIVGMLEKQPMQVSCTDIPILAQTPPRSSRSVFRGITGLSKVDATPRKMRLMKLVKSKEAHVRKLKAICKRRAGDLRALSNLSDSSVVRNLFSGMSRTAADFLIAQLRCGKRSPKGRRWTTKEKVMALALFKRGPRCYNFFRKIVPMPSKRTLLALLQKVPFRSGINSHLFKHLKNCLRTDEERVCVVVFDEIDIKEHLQYSKHEDRIVGFEELGPQYHSTKWANRALVFMLQGLARKWKQPVAFYFSHNGCPSDILERCLKNVINAAQFEAGLHVVGTICDMGSTNVKMLKALGTSIEHPYFEHNEKKIFTIYDPPHLLKCTASLFRKHNVELPVKIGEENVKMQARFSDIITAYENDKKTTLIFRALYKLKDSHLNPIMQYAMKVCVAAQIMSRSVAAYIYSLTSTGNLETRAVATATFVQQVDELFDSFNGSARDPPEGKALKCFITEKSGHVAYWKKAFNMVKNWTYLNYKKDGSTRAKPPSQIGWLTTMRGVTGLWHHLQEFKYFQSLRPRTLNQDCLENLFGCVRGGCGSGDNPTPDQFSASLKTQILNSLTHSLSGGNCEDDEHELLSDLNSFLDVDDTQIGASTSSATSDVAPAEIIIHNLDEAVASGSFETLSVAYVSGFIAKRLFDKIDCNSCKQILLSTSLDPHNMFILNKEWSDQERLQYPSEKLVVAVGHCITNLEAKLNICPGEDNIEQKIYFKISELLTNINLSCPQHTSVVTDGIARAICKIGIPWWCKRQNRERQQERKEGRSSKHKVAKFQHK